MGTAAKALITVLDSWSPGARMLAQIVGFLAFMLGLVFTAGVQWASMQTAIDNQQLLASEFRNFRELDLPVLRGKIDRLTDAIEERTDRIERLERLRDEEALRAFRRTGP